MDTLKTLKQYLIDLECDHYEFNNDDVVNMSPIALKVAYVRLINDAEKYDDVELNRKKKLLTLQMRLNNVVIPQDRDFWLYEIELKSDIETLIQCLNVSNECNNKNSENEKIK